MNIRLGFSSIIEIISKSKTGSDKMDYYDQVNLAIRRSLNDPLFQYQFYYFDEIVKLANIIIENTSEECIKDYSLVVPLNTSIQIVIDFFNTINLDYSNMFQNIL